MKKFYHILHILYSILTIVIGIFLVQGETILGPNYIYVMQVVMPAYLLCCGLMVSYICSLIWMHVVIVDQTDVSPETIALQTHILHRSFALGIVLGLIFAVSYILIKVI